MFKVITKDIFPIGEKEVEMADKRSYQECLEGYIKAYKYLVMQEGFARDAVIQVALSLVISSIIITISIVLLCTGNPAWKLWIIPSIIITAIVMIVAVKRHYPHMVFSFKEAIPREREDLRRFLKNLKEEASDNQDAQFALCKIRNLDYERIFNLEYIIELFSESLKNFFKHDSGVIFEYSEDGNAVTFHCPWPILGKQVWVPYEVPTPSRTGEYERSEYLIGGEIKKLEGIVNFSLSKRYQLQVEKGVAFDWDVLIPKIVEILKCYKE